MTLCALPVGLLAFSGMQVSEGRKGQGLVQRHESLREPLEIERYQLFYVLYTVLSRYQSNRLFDRNYFSIYCSLSRKKHCMLLSRKSIGLRKTFITIQLPRLISKPRFEGSILRHSHLQVQHCQQQQIYQALFSKRPSSAKQHLNLSQPFYFSIPFRRRSITTMAAADRSVLPDTYVLASIARSFC